MKHYLHVLLLAAVCGFLTSCGDSPEMVMNDHVDWLNDITEVVEKTADGSLSSQDATKALQELLDEAKELNERKAKVMADLSPEEIKALGESAGKEALRATMEMLSAFEKLGKSGRMTAEISKVFSELNNQ